MPLTTVPFPSDIRFVPRRRHTRAWLALLATAAVVLAALALPRSHPAARRDAPAAAVTHQAAHPQPAKAAITVTAGKAVYACTVVPAKPAVKPKR